jgi:hypothetical protein
MISRCRPVGSRSAPCTSIYHLPNENPGLWWLHYTGYGDPVRNAATLRGALQLTGPHCYSLSRSLPPAHRWISPHWIASSGIQVRWKTVPTRSTSRSTV